MDFCDRIGHIMAYGDGWYGGVYVAAMYSLAYVSDDIEYIVTEGLKAGEKIVIEGVQNLKDGQSITPITPAEKEAEYQKALKDQKEGNIQTAFQ